jgi:thioredoxin-related protein
MKIIAHLALVLLLVVGFSSQAQKDSQKTEQGLVWHTDIMKARELSAAGNKPIFAFFTGSDWCIWCKRLQHDVFSKPAFIEWANKNVILLELDFPRGKQLSPELAQQNNGLQQTFQVQGYPTIWIFFMNKDEQGQKFNLTPLGSCGYPQGAEPGKEEVKFIKDANALLAKKSNP